MPKLTTEQRKMYHEFSTNFKRCWACKVQPLPQQFRVGLYAKLDNAHIVGGSGRVANRRVINRLCKAHHMLNEGERLRHNGKLLPTLTLEHMLWLKAANDPEYFDVEFVRQCRIKKNGIVIVPPLQPLEPLESEVMF